jgi:two-component system, response regulator PdtaR
MFKDIYELIVRVDYPCLKFNCMFESVYDYNMKILIVEDDQVLALMLQQMINEMGYEVIDVVNKGADAIEKATQLDCDLILMDIMLEDDIDGIEAYKKIKSIRDIPVIYITGNSDPMNKQRAEVIGFFDFIPKPVIFEELEEIIEKLAEKMN